MTEYVYTGVFDYRGLVREISDSGLVIIGAACHRNTFTVEADLTAPDVSLLDGVVAAHDPDGLESKKAVRRSAIKFHTFDLLGEGVVVNTVLMGTRDDNLTYSRAIRDAVTDRSALMPMHIRGRNYRMYPITTVSDATDLVEAIEDRQKSVYDGEKALLDAIDTAADQAALDAVNDRRT